jgi:hypothetical protein
MYNPPCLFFLVAPYWNDAWGGANENQLAIKIQQLSPGLNIGTREPGVKGKRVCIFYLTRLFPFSMNTAFVRSVFLREKRWAVPSGKIASHSTLGSSEKKSYGGRGEIVNGQIDQKFGHQKNF